MTVHQFLKTMRDEHYCMPQSKEGDQLGHPSNSELVRWCKKGCVLLNGNLVKFNDEITFPITELVFFPKSKARCTVQAHEEKEFVQCHQRMVKLANFDWQSW